MFQSYLLVLLYKAEHDLLQNFFWRTVNPLLHSKQFTMPSLTEFIIGCFARIRTQIASSKDLRPAN